MAFQTLVRLSRHRMLERDVGETLLVQPERSPCGIQMLQGVVYGDIGTCPLCERQGTCSAQIRVYACAAASATFTPPFGQ
jgi:hypothetical protein